MIQMFIAQQITFVGKKSPYWIQSEHMVVFHGCKSYKLLWQQLLLSQRKKGRLLVKLVPNNAISFMFFFFKFFKILLLLLLLLLF